MKKKQCMADKILRDDADTTVYTDINQINAGNETHNCEQKVATTAATATVTTTTMVITIETIEIIQTRRILTIQTQIIEHDSMEIVTIVKLKVIEKLIAIRRSVNKVSNHKKKQQLQMIQTTTIPITTVTTIQIKLRRPKIISTVNIRSSITFLWQKKKEMKMSLSFHLCPLCGDKGTIYNYCEKCEDTGMIYDRYNSTDSNKNNIGTINDETILKITNVVLASDSKNEIFYFLLQVFKQVYGIQTNDLQAQFIAERCEIYRHFGIETVQQVIEKVRKLLTDEDVMERDDIDDEIDGMMVVGVV
jgi:hypothetical protein